MKRSFLLGILMVCIALTNIGGCNVFDDLYDHNTDEAIAVDVQKLIDAQLWNDAVLKWYSLTTPAQQKRANQLLLATAYAGRGGFNLINLVQTFAGGMSGTLFTFLLQTFKGATVADYNDLVTAQNIILGISTTAAPRTNDENVFLLFVEFAKLGSLMAATGDLNGDGTVDGTYDNCALSTAQGAEVVTALGNINDIITVIGSTLTGSSLTALTAACASLPAGSCTVTTASGVSTAMNQAGRTLVGESNLGVGLAAPYNNPYCQLSAAPIVPHNCPGNTGGAAQFTCP